MTTAELQSVPILDGVSEAGLERLMTAAAEVEAAPGQILAQLDDPGSGAFIILDGSVAVELRTVTLELGRGDLVGELALLVPETGRVARVTALVETRCLAIPRETFVGLVETEPTFALALVRELARRLVEARAGD
jgi:CPA1 family monovalent cation:H+ antiporter